MKIEPVSSNLILLTTRLGDILEILDSDENGLHISHHPLSSMLVLGDRPYPQENDNLGLHHAITLIFPNTPIISKVPV